MFQLIAGNLQNIILHLIMKLLKTYSNRYETNSNPKKFLILVKCLLPILII